MIAQIEVDGTPLGNPVDLYGASIAQMEQTFGTGLLKAGKHELRFVNRGKNKDSKGFFVGFDGMLLTAKK